MRSKRKLITQKENDSLEKTQSIFGFKDADYKSIRYGSHRDIRKRAEEVNPEWNSLDPECTRILLLYYLMNEHRKKEGRVFSPESKAKIAERIALLESNQLGELGPLMDGPSALNPTTNTIIGRKKLRDSIKREKAISSSEPRVSINSTPEIEALLKEKATASPDRARKIRQTLRQMGYFISKTK